MRAIHLRNYLIYLSIFSVLCFITEQIMGDFEERQSALLNFFRTLFAFELRFFSADALVSVRINGKLVNETFRERKFSYFRGDQSLATTIACIGPARNRSCLFTNLYYTKKTFWILTMKHTRISFPPVCIGAFSVFEFSPERRAFVSYEDLETFVHNQVHPIVVSNLTVYFEQPWLENIGHALFDGLYPAYVALIRFAPRHLHPFRLLVNAPNTRYQDCWSEDVYSRFSGLGSIGLADLEALSSNKWFVFQELLMGSGKMCQRCLQPNLQLPGGVELNASRLFRDRMYEKHGLQLPTARGNHSAEQRNPRIPLSVLVIDNKRFSVQDKREIHAAIDEINGDTRMRKNIMAWNETDSNRPLIQITYLDFRLLVSDTGSDKRQFIRHLQFLSTTDIHVTGPGTGQMYQTFLADGAVHINLGGIKLGSVKNISMNFTSFMEQYMTAGTPYIKGLYYPINSRPLGVKKGEVIKLVLEATQLIMQGFSLPVDPRENLAPDGQLFIDMCSLDSQFCTSVTERSVDSENACIDTWPEEIVHEYQPWSPNGVNHQNQSIKCPMNRTLLGHLRRKYGFTD